MSTSAGIWTISTTGDVAPRVLVVSEEEEEEDAIVVLLLATTTFRAVCVPRSVRTRVRTEDDDDDDVNDDARWSIICGE